MALPCTAAADANVCGASNRGSHEPSSRGPSANADDEAKPLRVLLVGNSYTRFNLLPTILEKLADTTGGRKLEVDVEARGGYSLRMHLRHGKILSKIKSGRYDYVVLQGHSLSAVEHSDELAADAQRFHEAIAASGAKTVLYQTWARRPNASIYRRHPRVRSFEQMASLVDVTYSNLARELGANLAPVGGAFEQAVRHDPSAPLWGSDGSHPSLAGTYMAACVLFGTITGADPRKSDFVPWTLKPELAEHIRTVAATTLNTPAPKSRSSRTPLLEPKSPTTAQIASAVQLSPIFDPIVPEPEPPAPFAPLRLPASADAPTPALAPATQAPTVAASIAAMLGTPPGMEPIPAGAPTFDIKSARPSADAAPTGSHAGPGSGKASGRPFGARASSSASIGSI